MWERQTGKKFLTKCEEASSSRLRSPAHFWTSKLYAFLSDRIFTFFLFTSRDVERWQSLTGRAPSEPEETAACLCVVRRSLTLTWRLCVCVFFCVLTRAWTLNDTWPDYEWISSEETKTSGSFQVVFWLPGCFWGKRSSAFDSEQLMLLLKLSFLLCQHTQWMLLHSF